MQGIKRKDTKVLIVEDEMPLRELLQMELTRSGYKVEAAARRISTPLAPGIRTSSRTTK